MHCPIAEFEIYLKTYRYYINNANIESRKEKKNGTKGENSFLRKPENRISCRP
jgi:hypothetical protein